MTICIIKGDGSRAVLAVVRDRQLQRFTAARTGDARGSGSVTTTGTYRVSFKHKDHISSIYEAAMPDSIFFNGDQAVHYSDDFAHCEYKKNCGQGGSSHGCVNIADKSFSEQLFSDTRAGSTRVVVVSR